MNALAVTARNIRHSIVETAGGPEVQPEIEAVLTMLGKRVEFQGTGYVNMEFTETVRFRLSPDGARNLAESLSEWADTAEREAASLQVIKEPDAA